MQEHTFDIVVQGLSIQVDYDICRQEEVVHAIRKFLCGDTVTNDVIEVEYPIDRVKVPSTGWDYIKSLLPLTLQFGWLTPEYRYIVTVQRQMIERTVYNVYPTDGERERTKVMVKRVPKEVWLTAQPFTETTQRDVERLTSRELAAILEDIRRKEHGYYDHD